jgi:photosystem II stability/assembly factor-like uncharacterized protein
MNTISKISVIFFLISATILSQPQWQQLNSGTQSYLYDLHFVSETTGWAVGQEGTILKTSNGGNSWIQQNSGTATNLRSVFFLNDQLGWIGGQNGIIIKTTNGGDDWQLGQTGYENETIWELSFVDENIGQAVVGYTIPGFYYSYIIKTVNGGTTWQLKYESEYGYDAYLDLFTIGDLGWAVGTGVIARTTNTGESWSYVYSPTDQWLYDVFFFNNTTGWAVGGGTDSEIILKSANGGLSWQILQESFQYQRLHGVAFTDLNNGWTVGENGVILQSTNGGASWSEYNSPTNSYLREVQFPSQSIGYIVGENGVILKYSNNSNYIHVLDPNGGEVITAGSSYYILWNSQNVIDVKIEYSTDNGINWISIIDSTASTGIYEWLVPVELTTQGRIKISDVTNPTTFDISDGPFTIQSSKVITVLTPNGGEILEGGSNYEITWSSTDVENVKIEYSINNGASWNLVIDSTQSTGIYQWSVPNILTTQARIKISDISLPSIYDISDNPFRINYVVDVNDPENFLNYNLMQNYPNPFNPSTTINYSVPEFTLVNLSVYDVLGRVVTTLVSDYKSAGNYSVEFDASDIPSGIYIYKITTSDFAATKKMILLK